MAEDGSSSVNPDLIIAHKFPETTYTYSERDAALYALGVGACAKDALDTNELKYVYHQDGQQNIQVLPTFAALFSLGFTKEIASLPGLPYDPRLLLHGQQYIEIYKPLPSNGSLQNKASVVGLHDKGKATILEIEVVSYVKESGELLCKNRMAVYLRGAGGFSKSSPPYSFSKYPKNQTRASRPPKTQPFAVFEECTQPPQACDSVFFAELEKHMIIFISMTSSSAYVMHSFLFKQNLGMSERGGRQCNRQIACTKALLYRLSGDYNPLHSDPMIAEIAGFSRPILHGLCTLGFAVRAIIRCICKGDSNMIKTISGQFLLHVYPGETLITEMWLEDLRVLYQVKVRERNRAVLSGFVDLSRLSSSL